MTVTTVMMLEWLVLVSVCVCVYMHVRVSECVCVCVYIPYKMKYWRGVNFGDWRFLDKIANI